MEQNKDNLNIPLDTPLTPLTPKPPAPPEQPKTMNFPEALKQIMDLKKVTRLSWNDPNEYALLQDDWLVIHTRGEDHKWTINSGDLEGDDWVVLP